MMKPLKLNQLTSVLIIGASVMMSQVAIAETLLPNQLIENAIAEQNQQLNTDMSKQLSESISSGLNLVRDNNVVPMLSTHNVRSQHRKIENTINLNTIKSAE